MLNTATLDRITFFYDIAIEGGRITGAQFALVNPSARPGSGPRRDSAEHLVQRLAAGKTELMSAASVPEGECQTM